MKAWGMQFDTELNTHCSFSVANTFKLTGMLALFGALLGC
jgi:hypothetical protein